MEFIRVVEFFPPLFAGESGRRFNLDEGISGFVSGIRKERDLCDLALVGDHKGLEFLKFSSVQAAALLEKDAGVVAAPTIVARDSNRQQILSSILTAYGLGLRNLMLVWGDAYPPPRPMNVYDFPDLAAVISEARRIANDAGLYVRLLAPVDLELLDTPRGIRVAKSRLNAGADLLLAQPPTTDAGPELKRHTKLLDAAGIVGSVLLNAFPFRSSADLLGCERFFGWKLPAEIHRVAETGQPSLTLRARNLVKALRDQSRPGVYVSTRGEPENAERILGGFRSTRNISTN